MVEKEPKVTPAIRLPQLQTTERLKLTRPPEPAVETTEAALRAPVPQMDEDLEDEEATDRPLRSQVSGDQPSLSRDTTGLRRVVSGLLQRALLNFAEQERQRARLLVILLLAQAASLLLILPGSLFGHFSLSGVLVVLGGLAFFGVVWLLHWLSKTDEACYLLVLGGGGIVVLDLLFSAAHLLSLETLHIALLFLLVILSSGILFSPETALILALIFALFTTLVLLVFPTSVQLLPLFDGQARYLTIIYLVIAQLGVGLVAWFFGRQMQESIHLITYVAGLEMTNKRLHKRLRQTAEKKRNLEGGLAIIQQTHARVAAGDYSARAHVEGDLLPLAVSLNLMLERVESFVHSEHERERMETAVAGLAEMAGKVGQESMGQLPVPTGTALDGLSIAIKQMQTNVNQRLARVQQAVTALITTVNRCQDGLLPVAEVLEEHLRSIDALVLSADNVMNSAQRQAELTERAEELLRSSAPAGVDLQATDEEASHRQGTSALRLAAELDRQAALAFEQAAGASEQQQPAPVEVEAVPAQGTVLVEPTPLLDEPAPASEQPAQDAVELEASAEQATSLGEQAMSGQKGDASSSPADGSIEAAADEASTGEGTAEEITSEQRTAVVPVSMPEVPATEVAAETQMITLADVDREAAEEVQALEAGWNLESLEELARVLSSMAGEATLQERNARTMDYKLRALLQGLPDTRRVDMMAAWLRAVLEAVTQSANQVRQASKALQVSTLASTSPEDTRSGE
jgi:hypothetical protein